MIQRIQTMYLFLVVVLLVVTMCLPLGYFVVDTPPMQYAFTPTGVSLGEGYQSSWGLLAILLLSAIVALASIFLYKNRMLQIRMTVFNSVLLVGFYLAFVAFYMILKGDVNALLNVKVSLRVHWALSFPLVAIILNYLAIRAIGHDEVLVKAADRLR